MQAPIKMQFINSKIEFVFVVKEQLNKMSGSRLLTVSTLN